MKAGLYKSVEFYAERPLAEVKACLQKEGQVDSHKWHVEAQDDRFQLMPAQWEILARHRVLWPEVFGFLTPHGTSTSVRLAFRPTAEGWVAWAFTVLCVLISIIFTAATGGLLPMLIFAAWDALLLLICASMVRCGKKDAVETVRQILEIE